MRRALLLAAFGLIVRWSKQPTLQRALDESLYTSFAHPLGPWAPVDRGAWARARETVHIYGATLSRSTSLNSSTSSMDTPLYEPPCNFTVSNTELITLHNLSNSHHQTKHVLSPYNVTRLNLMIRHCINV